jgi:hypothetical protein
VPERYELRPVSELSAGDMVYLMGSRLEVTGHPHQGDCGPEFRRVPVRKVADHSDVMAPPFEHDYLVPVLIEDDKAAVSGLAENVRDLSAAAATWRNRAEEAEAARDRLKDAARAMGRSLRGLGVIP